MTPFTPHTITDPAQLSQLIEIARDDGYAVVQQQLQAGVRGIAVPIINRHAKVVSASSLSIPMGNVSRTQALARILQILHQTASGPLNYL